MIGQAFMLCFMAALVMLSIHELVRYRRAARDPEGLPYPRRRLSRRLAVALLLVLILLICWFWPERAAVGFRLTLAGLMFVLLLLGMVLLFRDLLETSRSVVTLSKQLDLKTASEFQRLLQVQERRTKRNGDRPPAAPDDPSAGGD